MNKTLTENECLRFRQYNGTFNEMVQFIFDAGIQFEKDRLLHEITKNPVGSCNHTFERIINNE